MLSITFIRFFNWLAGLLLGCGLLGLGACGEQGRSAGSGNEGSLAARLGLESPATAGPEPRHDSMSVIRTVRADPRFRAQERWVRQFYRDRQFRLAWFRQHQLVPQADTLLRKVAKATDDGLDPKRYPVSKLSATLAAFKAASADTARRNTLERQADLELSQVFFTWASDYYRGIENPRDTRDTTWRVKRNKIKLDHALQAILGERESKYPYAEFAPLHLEYANLRRALARLRAEQAAGGWPTLPANTRLRPGQQNATVVPLLRQRLTGAGGRPLAADSAGRSAGATASPAPASTPAAGPAATYDPALVAAVKDFQRDLGLPATGEVSGATLRALNVPLAARIRQVILNMERWRWLPKSFEPDYLLVNLPEYRLRVFTDKQPALTMRVIIGKTLTATPIFSDKLEYVVLAPYWNVPFSIIDKELRPQLVANPRATLDKLDMEVVKGYGRKAKPVDPTTIDWAGLTADNWRYTLRKRPGPNNDLGNVKFLFPNQDDIYLHDTPHDQLFAQSRRDFSHGCVRVEDPVGLATYLLRKQPGWSQQVIEDTIARRREKYITLKEKLPVYLVYFTAWADAEGRPHFREDIYGHDKRLAQDYFQ